MIKLNAAQKRDMRLPKYREEGFLDFYEYHLALKGHPGCVYFMLPYLEKRFKLDKEAYLWLCYLNGVTQNIMTTWQIFRDFPDFKSLNLGALEKWHVKNWKALPYDLDRRYQKGHLVEMTEDYIENLQGKTQEEFFDALTPHKDPLKNFDGAWEKVRNDFFMFGRLSTFSYLEYLKIAGVNLDCTTLFLDDMSGSLSHRNGILKVMGHDNLEQHKKINPNVKHHAGTVALTEPYAAHLLAAAKLRFKTRSFFKDVNYFTLESTLCCYKSSFRVNRRYPNCYIDMMYDRIVKAAPLLGDDIKIFTDAREASLPEYALKGGITKPKQNHFRETGQVLFLGNMFPNKYVKGLETSL